MYREIIAVYSEIHTKHTQKHSEFLTSNLAVHEVTTASACNGRWRARRSFGCRSRKRDAVRYRNEGPFQGPKQTQILQLWVASARLLNWQWGQHSAILCINVCLIQKQKYNQTFRCPLNSGAPCSRIHCDRLKPALSTRHNIPAGDVRSVRSVKHI